MVCIPLIPELRRQRQVDIWVQGQPRLHRETLCQKTNKQKTLFLIYYSLKKCGGWSGAAVSVDKRASYPLSPSPPQPHTWSIVLKTSSPVCLFVCFRVFSRSTNSLQFKSLNQFTALACFGYGQGGGNWMRCLTQESTLAYLNLPRDGITAMDCLVVLLSFKNSS